TLSSIRGIVDVVRHGEVSVVIADFPEMKDRLLEAKSRYSNLLESLHVVWKQCSEIENQKEFALRVGKVPASAALFAVRRGKVRSFEEHLKTIHIDSVLSVLGYRGTD